jgi:hypothetical protein
MFDNILLPQDGSDTEGIVLPIVQNIKHEASRHNDSGPRGRRERDNTGGGPYRA